jgi:hypothetical protein
MINCTYSNGVKPPNVTVISPPVDNELLGTSGVSARGKPATIDSDGGATVVEVVVAVEPDCGTVGVVTLGTELSVGASVVGASVVGASVVGASVFSVLGGAVGSEIVKERMTSTASAYVALPAALAVNVQVPTVSIVTSNPVTVQTSSVVDVSTTGRFESEVAVITNGVEENSRSTGPANEMVWAETGLTTVDAGDDAVVVDPFVAVVVKV